MKRAKGAVNACVMGRDKRDGTHPACLSCAKQAVTCPFPCAVEVKSPCGANLEPEAKPAKKGKLPNKTETSYMWLLSLEFPDAKIRYEGLTFHMDCGHAYTPDAVVTFPDGKMLMVEIKPGKGKNGFRHGSYQRAKVAFDQCKVEYPQFGWRWVEKTSTGWDIF